jgi:formylglycine-generating enzyme required for sulfatase activity
MAYIPPGTFIMGSPIDELGRDSDETQHQVTLTKGFYIGVHEVTQKEYTDVMGYNPSYFQGCGDNCPVEEVSWFDAIDYCNALSDLHEFERAYTVNGQSVTWNQSASGYRLPTESEWEYACRAGTTTAFYNGPIANIQQDPNCDKIAWYSYNSGSTPHPFGMRDPNVWKLSDMSGNVLEWNWDWYGTYPPGPVTDPTGPASGSVRVERGGSWGYYAQVCRSANRGYGSPSTPFGHRGFRIARNAN